MTYEASYIDKLVDISLQYDRTTPVLNENNLEQFVLDVIQVIKEYRHLSDDDVYVIANYSKPSRKDVWYPAGIIGNQVIIKYAALLRNYNYLDQTFINKKDKISFILFIVWALNHELDHLDKIKLISSGDMSAEMIILRESYQTFTNIPSSISVKSLFDLYKVVALSKFFKEAKKLYQKYHSIVPMERFADISAVKLFVSLAQYLEIKDLKNAGLYDLKNTYESGYKNNISPTKFFFTEINNKLAMNKLGYVKYVDYESIALLTKDMSFENRLNLGVEITEEEFNEGIFELVFKK